MEDKRGMVQCFLMSEKIKQFKREQRDMEIRALIRWANESQAEIEARYNHNHDPKNGRFCSGGNNISTINVEIENFKVDKAAFDKTVFNSKFKGVTDTLFGDLSVAGAAKRCAYNNDGTLNETVIILRAKSGFQVGNDIQLGWRGGHIDVPDMPKNSLIIVHNHGNNAPFSFEDFMLVNDHPQIKTLIAVGHKGTVYKLSVGSGKRLDTRIKQEYNRIMQDFQRKYNPKTGYLNALQKYAEEYGWDFNYEE